MSRIRVYYFNMNILKLLREWFDPAYKEDDFDRIERIKQARLKFDKANKAI